MIYIKSQKEIELITKSCKILASVKKVLKDAVRPGISLKDLDSIAYNEIIKAGAKPSFLGYHGFQGTICASVNEELIHGIPSSRILKDQDLLSIDVGLIYEGYHSDSAVTISVGSSNEENDKLIEVAQKAFEAGLKAIKPNATIGDISYAIGEFVEKNGYSVVKEFQGHGIGREMHEDPGIPNYGKAGRGIRLQSGMTLAIEPMVIQGKPNILELEDGWTIITEDGSMAAHYENTILITEKEPEILTIL